MLGFPIIGFVQFLFLKLVNQSSCAHCLKFCDLRTDWYGMIVAMHLRKYVSEIAIVFVTLISNSISFSIKKQCVCVCVQIAVARINSTVDVFQRSAFLSAFYLFLLLQKVIISLLDIAYGSPVYIIVVE